MRIPNAERAGYVALPGLEADNLLGILAALGLLRALDTSRPTWEPRLFWKGSPWVAWLRTRQCVGHDDIVAGCREGLAAWGPHVNCETLKDVKFRRPAFRRFMDDARADERTARFAAALASELPTTEDGFVSPSPLILMFGQGHQHFLPRVVASVRNEFPAKRPHSDADDGLQGSRKIAEALFLPWRRSDRADGFRWDPTEDQRYALRYEDPTAGGAAPTVHGANRLAAIGFLSFTCFPRCGWPATRGVRRGNDIVFVWPIVTLPASLAAHESLLSHPGMISGRVAELRNLGVGEIMRAERTSNGKFLNVTIGRPMDVGAL